MATAITKQASDGLVGGTSHIMTAGEMTAWRPVRMTSARLDWSECTDLNSASMPESEAWDRFVAEQLTVAPTTISNPRKGEWYVKVA